jgi:hypothetical protein
MEIVVTDLTTAAGREAKHGYLITVMLYHSMVAM